MTTRDAPDWRMDAACATVATDLWFSEDGSGTHHAIKICLGCPVQQQCLEFAVDNQIEHGVFGGTTGRFRTRKRIAAA